MAQARAGYGRSARRPKLGSAFTRLLSADAVSAVGDGIRQTVIPLLAAHLTHSTVAVAMVSFAGTAPWILFSLLGGAVADRVDRRTAMVRTDAGRAVVVGSFAAWVAFGRPEVAALAGLAFFLGTAETLFDNAATAYVPQVVPAEALEAANGRMQAAELVGYGFLGPPAGAAVFAVAAAAPFGADAATFATASLLVLSIRSTSTAPRRDGVSVGIHKEVAEGVRWLLAHKEMRVLTSQLVMFSAFSGLNTGVLVLLIVRTLHASSLAYGIVLAFGALGGALASGPSAWLQRRFRLPTRLAIAVVLTGAAQIGMGLSPDLAVASGMLAVEAFGVVTWNVQSLSIRQRLIPPQLIGRVLGAHRLAGRGARAAGIAVGGVLASAAGVRAPFLIGGGLLAASGVFTRRLRRTEVALAGGSPTTVTSDPPKPERPS